MSRVSDHTHEGPPVVRPRAVRATPPPPDRAPFRVRPPSFHSIRSRYQTSPGSAFGTTKDRRADTAPSGARSPVLDTSHSEARAFHVFHRVRRAVPLASSHSTSVWYRRVVFCQLIGANSYPRPASTGTGVTRVATRGPPDATNFME